MPFIGKNPTAGFASIVKDSFTPNGSATSFTLSKQVANANDIAVFVGNVRQQPTTAYTVNGTTLDFGSGNAPASGLDFYVLHIAGTVESSVIPADGTISSAKLQTNAVTSTHLPVGSIIQVKQANVSGNLGAGTQDLVSVSITPTDNTNKILVMGSGLCYVPQGTSTAVDLYRDSTFIFRTAGGVGWGGGTSQHNNESFTPIFLDDPQTTSAITYKMQGLQTSGTGSSTWGYYDSSGTGNTSITVMEVVV